jgi:excisionase family DNA binding protein
VSTRTVRRWIDNKLLIAHRINGLVRISAADFAEFLAANRDGANDVHRWPPAA